MSDRKEVEMLRRHQADTASIEEHDHAPPTEGWRSYIGIVVRDDRFWPYTTGAGVLSGVLHIPGPPYVAMTRPLNFDPFDEGDVPDPDIDTDEDLIPVVCMNEAPIDGTQVVARNWDGRWVTDDAFGGYFLVQLLGYCGDVEVEGAGITVEDLAAPGLVQTATWHAPTGTAYTLLPVFFDPPPTGGTFTISFVGLGTTPPIAWDATATDVHDALAVLGITSTVYDGPLPSVPILAAWFGAPATFDTSLLEGTRNAIYQVTVGPYTDGGTYELIFHVAGGFDRHTPPIAWDATLEDVQAAVESIPEIGTGNVRVTDNVPLLAYGRYLLEFIGARAGEPVIMLPADITALTGSDPQVLIRTIQVAAKPTRSLAPVAIYADGGRFGSSQLFTYRTRGPYRITATGSFPDYVQTILPRAGRTVLSYAVGHIEGKICTCFGQVVPILEGSTPFGTMGFYPDYDGGGNFLGTWTNADVVALNGIEGCFASEPTEFVPRSYALVSGTTKMTIRLACAGEPTVNPPSLLIDYNAYVDYSTDPDTWYPIVWSPYMADPSTCSGGFFGTYPVASASDMVTYRSTTGSYAGTLPVALPLSISFSVTDPPFLAGTWTFYEP